MSAQNAHCVVLPVLARVGRTWIPLSPALVGTGRGFHIRKRERRKTVGKNHQRVNGRLLKTNSDDDRQTDEQIVSVVSSWNEKRQKEKKQEENSSVTYRVLFPPSLFIFSFYFSPNFIGFFFLIQKLKRSRLVCLFFRHLYPFSVDTWDEVVEWMFASAHDFFPFSSAIRVLQGRTLTCKPHADMGHDWSWWPISSHFLVASATWTWYGRGKRGLLPSTQD